MRWLAVAVFVVGCGSKKEAPPKNEFEAYERKYAAQHRLLLRMAEEKGEKLDAVDRETAFRAVFVGPSGVFVDRKLIATLAEIESKREAIVTAIAENAKMLPTIKWRPSVTFDLDAQPASVAIASLRWFAGRETIFEVRHDDPDAPQSASRQICNTSIRDKPSSVDMPQLSVLLDPDRTWVGLSKINEFHEIPNRPDYRDLEKLETVLKEHKSSALFVDRADVEIGARGGTSFDVLRALDIACNVGFIDIAVLDASKLSAVPQL